jgi:hypothetical protein
MEGMTDFQFKVFIKMILEILSSSKSLEDARDRVKALLG